MCASWACIRQLLGLDLVSLMPFDGLCCNFSGPDISVRTCLSSFLLKSKRDLG